MACLDPKHIPNFPVVCWLSVQRQLPVQAPVILILKNNKEKPGWVFCAEICLCWVRDWVFARPGWMVAPRQGLSCQPRVGFNPEAFLWEKSFHGKKIS